MLSACAFGLFVFLALDRGDAGTDRRLHSFQTFVARLTSGPTA